MSFKPIYTTTSGIVVAIKVAVSIRPLAEAQCTKSFVVCITVDDFVKTTTSAGSFYQDL